MSTLKSDTEVLLTVEDLIHAASPRKTSTTLTHSTPTPTTRRHPKAGAIHLTYLTILHRPTTPTDILTAHTLSRTPLTSTQRNDYHLKRQFLLDFYPTRVLSEAAMGALGSEIERERVREAARERAGREASVLRGQRRLQAIWSRESLGIEGIEGVDKAESEDDDTEIVLKDGVDSQNAMLAAMSHPNWEHWSFPTFSPFSTVPISPVAVAFDDDDEEEVEEEEEGFVLVDNEDEEGWTKLSLDTYSLSLDL